LIIFLVMFFGTVYTRMKSKIKYLEGEIHKFKKDVAEYTYLNRTSNN